MNCSVILREKWIDCIYICRAIFYGAFERGEKSALF
ncbi:RAxF-45 family protein [Bacillus cereus group sp. N34]|nr:RAxF-45 family protein [Bacillus cereus group sp. N34]